MLRFSGIWYWVLIVVVVILAAGITILFGETNDVPVLDEMSSPDTLNEVDPVTEVELQPEDPALRGTTVDVDPSAKVEFQQLFNDLRKEYLDTRAKSVDWWLEFIGILLTLFAVLIAIAGYIGFREFRRLRDEAERDANEIRSHLSKVLESGAELERVREGTETSVVKTESDEAIQRTRETLSAEVFATLSDDEEFEIVMQDFEQIPNLSVIDKTIVDAYRLQRDNRIKEAIQKWRSVATIVGETDKDLAARAWSSVGYLLSDIELVEKAVSAYNKAVEMKADYADAYYNRGVQRINLEQYLLALEDFNRAINLNFDKAKVYVDRGIAIFELGKHDDAFTEFDKAISMEPDYPNAQTIRGEAKAKLNDIVGAKADFQNALGLAKEQGEEDLIAAIEERLQELNEM